ncbi:reverse transcriptase domain-containing protein [Tanacetum coccineum]
MNQKADVLSKLALVAFSHLTKEVLVEVLDERSTEGQEIHSIVKEEGDNWMTPIRRYLDEGTWPKDKNEARCLLAKISQLRHTGKPHRVLWYAHRPTSRGNKGDQAGVLLAYHARRRQERGGKMRLMTNTRSCPLPPARGGAKFVIVAIDYFTKWIEAKPLVKITGKEVIRFVMDNIICRFGLP